MKTQMHAPYHSESIGATIRLLLALAIILFHEPLTAAIAWLINTIRSIL